MKVNDYSTLRKPIKEIDTKIHDDYFLHRNKHNDITFTFRSGGENK